MKCIADVNVLFPLLVSAHAARSAALAWWEEQADETVGWCVTTQLAILRHLTNPVIMGGSPVTPESAWAAAPSPSHPPKPAEARRPKTRPASSPRPSPCPPGALGPLNSHVDSSGSCGGETAAVQTKAVSRVLSRYDQQATGDGKVLHE